MSNDLTTIKGIGAAAAASLSEAGFTTVEAIANAKPEDLEAVNGFGPERAARTIAAAKEISGTSDAESASSTEQTEEIKVEPSVEPKVSPAAMQSSKSSGLFRPRVLIPTAAVIALAGFFYVNDDYISDLDGYVSDANNYVSSLYDSLTESDAPAAVQSVARDVAPQQNNAGIAAFKAPQRLGDLQAAGYQTAAVPEWVKKQRAEADKRQTEMQKQFAEQQEKLRAESEKRFAEHQRMAEQYRAEAQKRFQEYQKKSEQYLAEAQNRFAQQQQTGFQAPQEPEWVKQQRAEADKRQAEMQKRFAEQQKASFQAPREPEWVKQQRAEAEKFQAEAQKRFAETNRMYAAQAAAVPGYGYPYGAPIRSVYAAPYGYPQGFNAPKGKSE